MRVFIGTVLPRGIVAACAVALAIGAMARLVPIVRDQLAAPFDLISEGPHLELITAIREGFNIYAPESHVDSPFRLVPYLPLFHAALAIAPADPVNPFFVGRFVAMLFIVAAAATLFAVAPRHDWIGIPLAAFASFFLIRPIVGNTAYLRSDHAGVFFSAVAILTVAGRPLTRRRVLLAAVFSATALACKQSFLAASAAAFLFTAMQDKRAGALFAIVLLSVLGVLSALATIYWGRGFWYCIALPVSQYPRDWEAFFEHWDAMWRQPVFAFIAFALGGTAVAGLFRRTLFVETPLFLFFVLSLAVQTGVLSGIGSANHYFFEPILAALLWLVWSSTQLPRLPSANWLLVGVVGVLSVCAVSELRDQNTPECRYTTAADTAAHVWNRELVIDAMNQHGVHGELLNLKDSPVTFDYAREGRINVDDPYLFTALWDAGGLSADTILRRIRERYFEGVIVQSMLVSAAGQDPSVPIQNIIRVLFENYQVGIHGNVVNVLIPRNPNPAFGTHAPP
jgi:hypothetical protein